MEPAFWSLGMVPGRLLGDLALPRPAALATLLADLRTARFALVSGPPGCGKSTLAVQVAKALRRPAVVVSSEALLTGGEDDHWERLMEEAAARKQVLEGWETIGRPFGLETPLLVLDGLHPEGLGWARRLAARLDVLVTGPAGGTVPDPIPAPQAMAFLDRRCRQAGKAWTPAALREAADLADGSPEDLQRLGACCLQAALESRRSRIGMDILLEGALAAANPLPSGHARRLAGLPATRLALVKAMVRFPDDGPTGWAQRCGLEPKAAIVHLRRLEHGDGLVSRMGRGAYRIRAPLVRLHLQSRYGTVVRALGAAP